MPDNPRRRRFWIIPLICASFAIVRGLLAFSGWISVLPILASGRAKSLLLHAASTSKKLRQGIPK
jgi:hypothetical protein